MSPRVGIAATQAPRHAGAQLNIDTGLEAGKSPSGRPLGHLLLGPGWYGWNFLLHGSGPIDFYHRCVVSGRRYELRLDASYETAPPKRKPSNDLRQARSSTADRPYKIGEAKSDPEFKPFNHHASRLEGIEGGRGAWPSTFARVEEAAKRMQYIICQACQRMSPRDPVTMTQKAFGLSVFSTCPRNEGAVHDLHALGRNLKAKVNQKEDRFRCWESAEHGTGGKGEKL